MITFAYQAKNASGKTVSGTVAAASRAEAAGQLRGQNLTVVNLKERRDASRTTASKKRRGRIKTMEIVLFTRQMSTMISAGIPLLECLEIMCEQSASLGLETVLNQVIEDVRSGSDLSAAMAKHPNAFTNIYVNMIRAGESSGQLDVILVRLAEYQEASEQLKREIKSAMTYPVISLALVLIITFFLLTYIVPKFEEIFINIGIELPGLTRIVLFIGITLKDHALFVIGGAVVLIVGLRLYVKKTATGRRQWDWVMLHLPIFGPLTQKVALSRFSRTFGTLIRSGVPILGALEVVAGTAGNTLVAEAVTNARENVRQGENLAGPLGESGLFPPMVVRMIAVGEKSGALEQLLEKISEFYDQQVSATVDALTSMIEPLMIAFMGALVGTIVLSIFLPIIKIQEALQK